MKRYMTSEYVGIGHPDKVADQISDSIVDLYLSGDPDSRVAVETLVSGNRVVIAGEIFSKNRQPMSRLKETVIQTVEEAGYGKDSPCEFRSGNLIIDVYLKPQSSNIRDSVNKADGNVGAGDQGIMFGYAINDVPGLLPFPYAVAAELLHSLNRQIISHQLPGIYTDNKSQVCCSYSGWVPTIEKVILSTFHSGELSVDRVREIVKERVIDPVLRKYQDRCTDSVELLINSAGDFCIGGPEADAGVTGRKIIVDTYGGFASHGGGAFSGKDPSKVDRSAAYMARHIAKNLVANGHTREALVQLSYAIGHTQPFSVSVVTSDGAEGNKLVELVKESFDLSPKGIIEYLHLTDPSYVNYKKTAQWGHFFDPSLPWEKLIKL